MLKPSELIAQLKENILGGVGDLLAFDTVSEHFSQEEYLEEEDLVFDEL